MIICVESCSQRGAKWTLYDVATADVWNRLFEKAKASDAAAELKACAKAAGAAVGSKAVKGKLPKTPHQKLSSQFHKITSHLELHRFVRESASADRTRSTRGRFVAKDTDLIC